MTPAAITRTATLIVAVTGALWGTYWIPLRALADMGLPGAWGTVAVALAAALILSPAAPRLAGSDRLVVGAIALGGFAFTLYSVAFLYGKVSITVILFFLTPVWSTLLGRLVMGWHTPVLRYAAIAVGLAGLAVITGVFGGERLTMGLGEWMGLASGVVWATATTAIRARPALPVLPAAFAFNLGALASALVMAPLLAPVPPVPGLAALGVAAVTGAIWWGLFIAGLMWAAVRLDPARTGILLMGEVLVGAATAAWLGGERLSGAVLVGGGLVLLSGALEVWPVRSRSGPPGEDPGGEICTSAERTPR